MVFFDPNSQEAIGPNAATDVKAKRMPQRLIYDSKRIIGRKFTDPIIKEHESKWPFKVVEDP